MKFQIPKKTKMVFLMLVGLITVMKLWGSEIENYMAKQVHMLEGYVEYKKEDKGIARHILDIYMPVVGYVDSRYIDTTYMGDPSFEKNDIYSDNKVSEPQEMQEDAYQEIFTGDNLEMENAGDEDSSGNLNGNSEVLPTSSILSNSISSNNSANGINVKFSKAELLDLKKLVSQFYTVTSITELKPEIFDVAKALEQDFSLEQDNSNPQILIFHTHSQEGFADSTGDMRDTGIVAVGSYLAEILSSQYGYNVIHDTSIYDYVDGVLDRSKAYSYAEQGIEMILEQYPSVEVVLDIHRDGVEEDVHLVSEVDGKETARFMLFNGISYSKVKGKLTSLENPYVQDNLAMSLQMYLLGQQYYPGLLRKNYVNAYRYCLHFRPKSMLIEVGAQNNTLEEELNAMEPLADLLNRLLSGEKAYE